MGKPSSGKSTFFKAATMVENVEISPRPFTTIKPNRGVGYVRATCPCKELSLSCSPRQGKCVEGTRFVPVELLDVAGLVPGAHEGRGLGNQFLSDLARADCLIHVVDVSGTTDSEGNLTIGHNPSEDVRFLADEISWWFFGILEKNWRTIERRMKTEKAIDVLSDVLSGLNIKRRTLLEILADFSPTEGNLLEFARILREKSKPIIIAANKIDLPKSKGNLEVLRKDFPEETIVPVFSEGELALRQADHRGLVSYVPGSPSFYIKEGLTPEQKSALTRIGGIINSLGSSGVEECLERAVFSSLGRIVVFAVENESKFSDRAGNVLPDALLLPPNSNPKDLAGEIHSDLAKSFISAVDARRKVRISADEILKSGAIVKIISGK